ncbi:MAG: recombinase family protein [Lachnospiraceae bacterium]|nr:recombinase family protein [Lachnospiraceae bacterium]
MERVALYARVSSEEQVKHGLSLAEQEHSLEEYAKAHKMKVVDKYIDAGISGRKRYTKRPEMLRLLEDVKANKIDTVLFIRLDRWFRSIVDYYEVQKILDEHHTAWIATQEDYETVTASGQFKVNIMLSVAQNEADRTSERIKFVFEGKRERNEPVSGSVPKGYKIEGKHIVIDEEVAPFVRKAFDGYLETGASSKAIKAVPELNLAYYTARHMFTSTAYMGEFSGLKIPPIITPEEHERIMSMQGHIVRKVKENRIYLFSGLLFCPLCGARLGSRFYSRTKLEHKSYYACTRHVQMSGCEFKKMIREDRVEDYLLTHIDSQIEAIIESEKKQTAVSHKSERNAIKRKLSKLSELYVNDMISMEDYKRQYSELNADLEAIPPDAPIVDVKGLQERFFLDWQNAYAELPDAEKQIFWRGTVKSITASEDGSVKNFVLL